jgi:hypothetical protein
MPIVTKTKKIYKGKCPECRFETKEMQDREEASEDLKRHQKNMGHSATKKSNY